MRLCPTCGQYKPNGSFYPRKDRSSGFRSRCSSCDSIKAKQWRQDHPNLYSALLAKRQEQRHKSERFQFMQGKKKCACCLLRVGLGVHLTARFCGVSTMVTLRLKRIMGITYRRKAIRIDRPSPDQKKQRRLESGRKCRAQLSDGYIAKTLARKSILTATEIPKDLIALKREQLIAIRLIRKTKHQPPCQSKTSTILETSLLKE